MNDLLQTILGSTYLIKNHLDEKEIKKECLQVINESVEKIEKIIKNSPQDLKNKLSDPLIAIKGAAYVIQTQPLKTQEMLQLINNNVNKITQILEDSKDKTQLP